MKINNIIILSWMASTRHYGILGLSVKDNILYLQFFHSKHDQESHRLSGHSLLQLILSPQIWYWTQAQICEGIFCQIPTSDNAVCLYQWFRKRILHTNCMMYMKIRSCQLKERFVWRKMTDFSWSSRVYKLRRWQLMYILII